MIRIVQATVGTFHHFHLAREFNKRTLLQRIFSTFPRWKLRGEGIPDSRLATFPWIHVPVLAKWKWGIHHSSLDAELLYLNKKLFNRYIAKNLPECDAYVGLSGCGWGPGQVAQSRGTKFICDRGSTHARYGETIRAEEASRMGTRFVPTDERFVSEEEMEYDLADAITVPSEFARRSFIKMGLAPEKIHKIPYGVNLEHFRKSGSPPDDRFEVLFVGQISFRKGVPYLLDGFAKLDHPAKRLRIIGAVQPEIRDYLRSRRFEDVEFLGEIPHLELKEFMSTSHVLVLPSIEEGLAMVQAQALACGCPVISSTHTGSEDLYTDGVEGFIVPIRDSSAITDRLEKLAQDPNLRSRMSERAILRVKRLGGWDNYGEQYSEFLKSLVARN